MKTDFITRTNNNIGKDIDIQLNITVFNAHKENDDVLNYKVN